MLKVGCASRQRGQLTQPLWPTNCRLSCGLRSQKPSQSCWMCRCSAARGPRQTRWIPSSKSLSERRQFGPALTTGPRETPPLGYLCLCSDPEAAVPAKRVIEDPEGKRPCTKVSSRKGLAVRRWARTSAAIGTLPASVASDVRTLPRAREPRRLCAGKHLGAHTENSPRRDG